MQTSETTNGKLDEVIKEIDVLIDWALADAEHAAEHDAEETSADDRMRAANLKLAKQLLQDCRRD